MTKCLRAPLTVKWQLGHQSPRAPKGLREQRLESLAGGEREAILGPQVTQGHRQPQDPQSALHSYPPTHMLK